jgi:hypothetical protein
MPGGPQHGKGIQQQRRGWEWIPFPCDSSAISGYGFRAPLRGPGMTRRYPLPILALSLVMAGLVPAIPIAWSAELLFIGITALDTLSRHGRPCAGHPDPVRDCAFPIGITGTSPGMTGGRV